MNAPRAQGAAADGVEVWDYPPAPETLPVEIPERIGLFLEGEFREARSGAWLETLNPATEEPLARVAHAGAEDVEAAVASARRARARWARLPGRERAKFLFRIARRIQERSRELAVLESLDSGKPIRESRDLDLPEAARHFFYYAGWADKLRWALPGPEPRPVGVCGQILPWNSPLRMAAWKIAPALACGNTVVLKPAETTPLTALRLAEILQEVELPPGVVNILPGDGATGEALARHPGVDKIAFTGSTAVGKRLAALTAGSGRRLTLELGGRSPHLVFEDADLDQAVEGIVDGIFFHQGQAGRAGSWLLVQESVEEAVLELLERRVATLRLGDPLDKNTDIGAIHSRLQLERIQAWLRRGEEEGAVRHTGGCGDIPERGYWCRPTWFTGVEPAHSIARQEVFGPVLAVLSFRTPEEALTLANHSPDGLAASVWTDKGSRLFEVAAGLRAGVVWGNTCNRFDAASPFGGYKESGFGREGGLHGLLPYLRREGCA